MAIINFKTDADGGYDIGYEDGKIDGITEVIQGVYDLGKEKGEEAQKAKLEEVSFTENGTYEREDGWNKVIVDVDSKPTKISVLDAKIRFGYSGWSAIPDIFDFTGVTNFNQMFYNNSITSVPENFFDGLKPTSMIETFRNCSSLTGSIHIDASEVTNMNGMFYSSNISEVYFGDTKKNTRFDNMFNYCQNLSKVDVIDFTTLGSVQTSSNIAYLNSFFGTSTANRATSLSIGFRHIGFGMTNTSTSYNPFMTNAASKFDADTRQSFIDALVDYTGGATHTMKIHSAFLSALTQEQIAQATAKNWVLS